jgi:WD40 repeat protein
VSTRYADFLHCPTFRRVVAVVMSAAITLGCDRTPTDPEDEDLIEEPSTPDLAYTVAVNRRQEFGTAPAIALLGSDGTIERTITCAACWGTMQYPRWSRDGRMLSLEARRDTFSVLLVVNRDGSGLREVARVTAIRPSPGKITTPTYPRLAADWSADGRLVYTRSTPTETALETVNADGTGRNVIYQDSLGLEEGGTYRVIVPRWGSADGTISAVIDGRIYGMNADGSNMRILTPTITSAYGHSWSPDGRRIAFTTSASNTNTLMSMDVASGAIRSVYTSGVFRLVRGYCWSPDGARFSMAIGEFPTTLTTINADGTSLREEAQARILFYPKVVWSPDGRYLLFLADEGIPGGSRGMQLYRVRLRDRQTAAVSALPDLYDYSLAVAEGESCSQA